jgi:hypothetical protein
VNREQDKIVIRILDMEGNRLSETERFLRNSLKARNLHAVIHCVGCGLEIARSGFSGMTPALTMNGYTVSAGDALTQNVIDMFCDKLLVWLDKRKEIEVAGG